MTTSTFYVLIIGPGGEENYVKCDPSRLARNSFRLYVKQQVRDGVNKYTAVNGGHALCKLDEVDVTLPREKFIDLKDQCRDVLCALGEHGERLFEELFAALDLPRLMSALAKADAQEAEAVVQDIMYGVMGMASRCAGELAETHSRADNMTSAVEGMGSVLDQAPSMSRDIYLNWSSTADGLNTAVERLRAIEDGARKVLADVERGQKEWAVRMDRSSSIIQEALAALETDDEAFILKAYGYRGEPEKRDEMREAVTKAQVHIAACRNLERACRDAWDTTVQRAQEGAAQLRVGLPKAMTELKTDTRRLTEFDSQYGKEVPRPFVADSSLITEEEYRQALSYLCDEAWGPMACERRLCHLFDSILAFCGMRPELPHDVANAVKMAEQYAADVLKALEEETTAEVVVAPLVETSVGGFQAAPAVIDDPAPAESRYADIGASGIHVRAETPCVEVGQKRLAEIYDLMTAVAYVMTVENRRPFSSTTVKSLLRILAKLGKCTEDEATAAKPAIQAKYHEDSVKAESLKDAMALQKTATQRWIRFKIKVPVAKLSDAFAGEAKRTLLDQGLSSEAVHKAHAETRDDVHRKYDEKCRARAANGGKAGEGSEESDE